MRNLRAEGDRDSLRNTAEMILRLVMDAELTQQIGAERLTAPSPLRLAPIGEEEKKAVGLWTALRPAHNPTAPANGRSAEHLRGRNLVQYRRPIALGKSALQSWPPPDVVPTSQSCVGRGRPSSACDKREHGWQARSALLAGSTRAQSGVLDIRAAEPPRRGVRRSAK